MLLRKSFVIRCFLRWTPSVQPLLVNPVVLSLLGKGFTSNRLTLWHSENQFISSGLKSPWVHIKTLQFTWTKQNIWVLIKNPSEFLLKHSAGDAIGQGLPRWWQCDGRQSLVQRRPGGDSGETWSYNSLNAFLPRLSKKNENLSSPMEKKRQRSNSKDLKHVSRSVRKQRRLPADCGSPCLSKLPFCNKHLQTSNSLTVLFTPVWLDVR